MSSQKISTPLSVFFRMEGAHGPIHRLEASRNQPSAMQLQNQDNRLNDIRSSEPIEGKGTMRKKQNPIRYPQKVSAQPRLRQKAPEIQPFGTVKHLLPLELVEPVRLEITEQLNRLLADTITLRDLYKKAHWQTSGPTFYQLHLLYDKHYGEQVELVDAIAERIQMLGGVSIAMAAHVAEDTDIEVPPRGREEVPVQLSRLLDAHQIIIRKTRRLARRAAQLGDDGTNDLLVSDVLRTSEMQVWFLSEHLVDVPLVEAGRIPGVMRTA